MYVNQHDFFISKDKVLEEAAHLGPDDMPQSSEKPPANMLVAVVELW
jgi:hypothetical protein